MRIQNFTTLLCCINKHYLKSKYFKPQCSVFVTVSRSFSQWDIVSSVCLERKPVISQPLTPLEERYQKYIQKLEVEKSYLSDHEKRHIEDRRVEQKLKAGTIEDMDSIAKQTAQDFEDACIEEFKKMQFASRTTEADLKNDKHSTQRKLDSSLVLVVKEKLGNDFKWVLPQTIHEEGETLRQTAERALHQVASCNGKVQLLGNAPVGYYKYKYPKVVRGNGVIGAKVFFFKAVLLDPKEDSLVFKKTDSTSDYLWLTHSELEEVLVPVLNKAVQSFLFPDVLVTDAYETVLHSDDEERMSSAGVNQA